MHHDTLKENLQTIQAMKKKSIIRTWLINLGILPEVKHPKKEDMDKLVKEIEVARVQLQKDYSFTRSDLRKHQFTI